MNSSPRKNLIMCTNNWYRVHVEKYAEGHFIKSFSKTYKKARDKTFVAIKEMLHRIDKLLLTTKAEKIHSANYLHLVKCEFAIAWLSQSPHKSGNRYIILLDEKNRTCSILLLYAKATNIQWNNETQRRENEIRVNYPDIKKHFTGL